MPKQFWLSLPVKDINRSKEFFTKLGFTFNTQYGNTENSACLLMGEKNVAVMLFDEPTFKKCISNEPVSLDKAAEVLLSIDAESKEEVDEMVEKAIAAGGKSNHKPKPMEGWMYGCLFTDLDGHRWNVLYMDMSKMPKG
jgi:predicted lactoylglutathione lyase